VVLKWIGKIPKEWELLKARFIFRQRNEKGNKNPVLLAATQKFGMIPQSDVEGVVQVKEETDLQQFKTVHKNDYVISLRSFQGGFEYSLYEGVCSPAYQVFYAVKGLSKSYYKILFKSDGFIEKMNSLTVGIREGKNILYKDFAASYLPIPPIKVQNDISSFLDSKCAKIDEYLSRQQQVIEKLKEYKQSVITETVTKGLDPDVPMKDSGVEWIGRIPNEWEIGKTLYALKMPITDGPHETPNLYDEGIPFVSAEAVSSGKIDFEHIRGFISRDYYNECCRKYKPQKKDIYMVKSGATTGRVALVDTDAIFTIWSPLAVFRVRDDRMFYKFLYYFLQSEAYQKQVITKWSYGTQQNIGMRVLEKIVICYPPICEQRQIASYLDTKCAAIDAAIKRKQELIDKMTEYKKSLIYEAVTGKMEV
jgi:type I restriction enzyme S subunit